MDFSVPAPPVLRKFKEAYRQTERIFRRNKYAVMVSIKLIKT